MTCVICHQVISDNNYIQVSGRYYHDGEGKWDVESCYQNMVRIEGETELGMGTK